MTETNLAGKTLAAIRVDQFVAAPPRRDRRTGISGSHGHHRFS